MTALGEQSPRSTGIAQPPSDELKLGIPRPLDTEHVELPAGCMGFTNIVREMDVVAADIGNFRQTLYHGASEHSAFIAIPDDPKLKELVAKNAHEDVTEEIDARLSEILSGHGWKKRWSFSTKHVKMSPFDDSAFPVYSQMYLIPHGKQYLELPPGIYPADLPQKIEAGGAIPEGIEDVIPLVRKYTAQFFPGETHPPRGSDWVRLIGGEGHFAIFQESYDPGRQPGGRKGQWVVMRTPTAVKRYLEGRFGATLDLDKGIIVAPEDQISHIKGRLNPKTRKSHWIYLEEIVGKTLRIVPLKPQEAIEPTPPRVEKPTKGSAQQVEGERREGERLVVKFSGKVTGSAKDALDSFRNDGYMIIRIADTQWAVASSEQGAREYLRIAHQADLVLDASRTTGLIVCAKDHAGHIIGKEGRNIKRLAEACGVERLTVRVRKASPLKENPQAS